MTDTKCTNCGRGPVLCGVGEACGIAGKFWVPKQDFQAEFEKMFVDVELISHKHDQGKPRLGLCPPGIIEAVGIIRDYGTRKYGNPHGWKEVELHRYVDAMMRHLVAYLRDPASVDEESGYPHIWHLACNVAFLIEFENGTI